MKILVSISLSLKSKARFVFVILCCYLLITAFGIHRSGKTRRSQTDIASTNLNVWPETGESNLESYKIDGFLHISHALVISCDSNRERSMSQRMKELSISFGFYRGVSKSSHGWDAYQKMLRPMTSSYRINSLSALGILATWRHISLDCCKNPNCSRVLIFEDDVYFSKDFEHDLSAIADSPGFSIYDVIYLGANCDSPCNLYRSPDEATLRGFQSLDSASIHEINTISRKRTNVYGAFGILVTKAVFCLLSNELFDLSKATLPLDVLIETIYHRHHLRTGIIFPYLVIPDVRESTNMGPRNFQQFASQRLHLRNISRYIGAKFGHNRI
jgi:hypothetical protein